MLPTLFAETELKALPWELILAVFAGIVLFSFLVLLVKQYKRCPSNRILVIYGKTGGGNAARCIHGGGRFVVPLFQDYKYLYLEPIQIEIPLKGALSMENIRVNVPSVFTVAIGTDPATMQNAAIRLLGLNTEQIKQQAGDIIFGQLRQVIASMKEEHAALPGRRAVPEAHKRTTSGRTACPRRGLLRRRDQRHDLLARADQPAVTAGSLSAGPGRDLGKLVDHPRGRLRQVQVLRPRLERRLRQSEHLLPADEHRGRPTLAEGVLKVTKGPGTDPPGQHRGERLVARQRGVRPVANPRPRERGAVGDPDGGEGGELAMDAVADDRGVDGRQELVLRPPPDRPHRDAGRHRHVARRQSQFARHHSTPIGNTCILPTSIRVAPAL
jgi:hypothetical protein